MPNWYTFSIAALLLLGTQRFLYKVAAEKNYSSALTTAIFMATVSILSAAVFFATEGSVANLPALIGLSLLNSCAFALTTVANIEALKHLPAGITFPLTRLSLVVVILVSIALFGERLTPANWFGILLALSVVIIIGYDAKWNDNTHGNVRSGFFFVAICIVCGALASISSKLAADSVSKTGFMALSYLFGTCFSLLIERKFGKGQTAEKNLVAVRIGVLMGGLNFFGFYAFLMALASGPLSAIASLTGMHFVIAIILSVLFYKEQITPRRSIGIGLTILAVFFLRQ